MFKNTHIAMSVSPFAIMPFMLFSGFYKNRSNFLGWIGWIEYISPLKYAFEAFATNEYENSNYLLDPL